MYAYTNIHSSYNKYLMHVCYQQIRFSENEACAVCMITRALVVFIDVRSTRDHSQTTHIKIIACSAMVIYARTHTRLLSLTHMQTHIHIPFSARGSSIHPLEVSSTQDSDSGDGVAVHGLTDPRRHAGATHDVARRRALGENDPVYQDGVLRERAVGEPEEPEQDVFGLDARLFNTGPVAGGQSDGRLGIPDKSDGALEHAAGSKDETSDLPELGDKDEFDDTLEEQINNLRANGAKDDASEEFCRYSISRVS
jgi:hypothetical protein